jgi:UDP:flavonoid glycosyltransferase YjiC (YdhE family)
MNVLFASLATPGFVFPMIAIADRMRERGHDVAFVTDRSFERVLSEAGHYRIPRSVPDGPSFQMDRWADPIRVAIQLRHIEHALTSFRPDAIFSSSLTFGPLIARELHGVPVAVLGSIVLLWRGSTPEPVTYGEKRCTWRYAEYRNHLEMCRRALGLTPSNEPYERSLIFGDRTLLQGVPELSNIRGPFPPAVELVGDCTAPMRDSALADDEAAWLAAQRRRGRMLLYVQLGRVFDHNSYWPPLLAWLRDRDVAAVVCAERYDGAIGEAEDNVLVRPRIAQDAVLPLVDAVACSGHPTAVLGAIRHGLPMMIAYTGSGTEDTAEACERYGVAVAVKSDTATAREIAAALDHVVSSAQARAAAERLSRSFACYDGPAAVCGALETLSAVPLTIAS